MTPVRLRDSYSSLSASLTSLKEGQQRPATYKFALDALAREPFAPKSSLKKVFNMYSDNIYYTKGSQRANAYLGGGAVPSTGQTNAYLQRNVFIDNIDLIRSELTFLSGPDSDGDEGDLLKFLADGKRSLAEYLQSCSPPEIKRAESVVAATLK